MAFGDPAPAEPLVNQHMLAELDAISRTPEFERAPVMRRLLGFLIQTTIAGQGDELKAYTVAVEGLGRDPDFDAGSDSYPRVQVGRLRKMLEAYYAARPANAPRLLIKSGGYRVDYLPHGLSRPADATAAAPPAPARRGLPRPWIAALALLLAGALVVLALVVPRSGGKPRRVAEAPVLELAPVAVAGGGEAAVLARGARTLLSESLGHGWLVRVREPRADPTPLPARERPVYRLQTQVDTTGALGGRVVSLTLIDVASGDHLWARSVAVPAGGAPLVEALRPALASLAGPFGVIGLHQRRLATPGRSAPAGYGCLLGYDSYFRYRDPPSRAYLGGCIDRTIAAEPLSAPALAAASALAFDPAAGDDASARRRGADFARRAVAADPNSPEAQLADARAAFIAGECLRGREASDRAISLAPHNPELIGLAGFMRWQCGDASAATLLGDAVTLDPDVPLFYRVALIMILVERGDPAGAVRVAATTRRPGAGMSGQYHLVRALAEAARGNTPAAHAQWRRVVERSGQKVGEVDAVLAQYLWSPMFRARVGRFLAQSGVARAPIAAGA